jgi:hypothetical protein
MDEYRAVIHEEESGVRLEPTTDLPTDQKELLKLAFEVSRALGEFGMHPGADTADQSTTAVEPMDPVRFLRGESAMPWKRTRPYDDKPTPNGGNGESNCWVTCVPTPWGARCTVNCD